MLLVQPEILWTKECYYMCAKVFLLMHVELPRRAVPGSCSFGCDGSLQT